MSSTVLEWFVWHIPWLRHRREREIKAWAEYGAMVFELHIADLPEDLKKAARRHYLEEV